MIRYYLENPDWSLERATEGASGYDLRAAIGTPRTMEVGERWLVSTGLYLEMPRGVEAQVRSRSGLAINHGVIVLNAPGTVDSDYRGEVKVSLINHSQQVYIINPGDRVAQLVIAPVFYRWPAEALDGVMLTCLPFATYHDFKRVLDKSELSDTSRGSGGHGSTGR